MWPEFSLNAFGFDTRSAEKKIRLTKRSGREREGETEREGEKESKQERQRDLRQQ